MAAYQVLLLNTAVPQIQAAQSGDTYVCPRDIQITANLDVTGNTILGDASTDTVRVNGYMGVGGAASSAYNILFTGSTTSGNNQYGVGNNLNHNLAGTTWSAAFLSTGSIAASTAVSNAAAYRSINLSLGSGATIVNQHGVHIGDLTSGTNNYGITSLVSSGTDKWNIYASGTAANYFAGNVGIGTSSPTSPLHVVGAAGYVGTFDGATDTRIDFKNSGTRNGIIQSSSASFNVNAVTAIPLIFLTSSAERLRIDSSGNVGIGTSSPASQLHVVGDIRSTGDIVLIGGAGTPEVQFFQNSGNWKIAVDNDAMQFIDSSAAVERLRIDSSGNLISTAPTTPPTLSTNGTMVFNLTSDTNLRISVRGSDGVTRTANITLA